MPIELIRAVMANDADLVRQSLKAGFDVHGFYEQPLRHAAEHGYADIAAILIAHGADVHVFKDEPLRAAVRGGHAATVRVLLDAGADANADDGEALIQAATHNHIAIAEALLAAGATPARGGNAALGRACYHGHPEIVEMLVEAGADIFAPALNLGLLAKTEDHDMIFDYLAAEMKRQKDDFITRLNAATDVRAFLHDAVPPSPECGFVRGVRMGLLAQVADKMQAAGVGFTIDTAYGVKGECGRSLLALAADTGQLPALFQPHLWDGHLTDMSDAYHIMSRAVQILGGLPPEEFDSRLIHYRRAQINRARDRHRLKPNR